MAKNTNNKEPQKRGAKGKWSPELQESICKMIRSGCTAKDAAILNDITQETYYKWKKENNEFSEHIEKAESFYKNQLLLRITKASDKSWQAAAWRLERQYRDEFALRMEQTGANGEPIKHKVDLSKLSIEELKMLDEINTKLGSKD